MATTAPTLNSEPTELTNSIRRSLKELLIFKANLDQRLRVQFNVRVHSILPFGSAILLDHEHEKGRIQIETKPYKAGLQKSFAFEVIRTKGGGLYDVLAGSYIKLLADGQSLLSEEEI